MSGEALRDDAPAGEHATDTAGDAASGEARAADSATDAPAPPTPFESIVNALLEASPDVADHVVKAAQELLLAVQVVVDAADRAVKEQQDVRDG